MSGIYIVDVATSEGITRHVVVASGTAKAVEPFQPVCSLGTGKPNCDCCDDLSGQTYVVGRIGDFDPGMKGQELSQFGWPVIVTGAKR